jgi:hypothetical protein
MNEATYTRALPVVANVTEVRGRRDYRHLGEFKFAALPRVGDMISLIFSDSFQTQVFVVTGCNHLPMPLDPTRSTANETVERPHVQIDVQFHHIPDDPD